MRTSEAFTKLGLPQIATAAEVKSAYRRKAASEHPDKGGSASAFQDLNEAYEVAMRETVRPVRCSACEGSGKVAFAKAGFAAVERRCNACRGTGYAERGTQTPVPLIDVLKAEEHGFDVKQVRAALESFKAWLQVREGPPSNVETPESVVVLITLAEDWLETLRPL